MKRLFLIPILALCALGFSSGTASAANCTAGASLFIDTATFGGPVPAAQQTLSSCTQVEAARFYLGSDGSNAYFTDGGLARYITHYLGINACGTNGLKPTTTTTVVNCTGVTSTYTEWIYHTSAWWGGCRSVTLVWSFQIKNSATHTWGSKTARQDSATLCT